MPKVIGYSYNAAHHCEKCTLDYARKVPYAEWLWGEHDSDDEHYYFSLGVFNLKHLVEDGIIRDGEDNAIHAIMSTDEWYGNEMYEGETTAVLVCDDCGTEIDRKEWR